jgi:rod shape-determining protein MreC
MRTTFDRSTGRTRFGGISRRMLLVALALMVVACVLIVLDRQGIVLPLKGRAQAWLSPAERFLTQTRLSVQSASSTLFRADELSGRVAELEREVSALRQENIRLQSMQAENTRLKVELGVRETYEWMTVTAGVVQANAENGRRMIRIDRGEADGLKLGMAVVSKEGGSPAALIGVIDALYMQTADVLLITDYGSNISANTTQLVQAKGLVIGQWQLGSRIKLVDVEPSVPLAVNDYVVTAGLSKGLATDTPMAQVLANIPIGTVTSVERTNHTQTAEVQPFVDPDRVRNVWVITGSK